MPLTVTQAQILKAHLDQFHEILSHDGNNTPAPKFQLNEVIGTLIYELGPFVMPDLANELMRQECHQTILPAEQRLKLCGLVDSAREELQSCLDTRTLTGSSFREIIAQIIQEFGTIIIQALVNILIEPDDEEETTS